jgi:hypothetical protein
MNTKKKYSIKKMNGQKTVLLNSWDCITAELFKMSVKLKADFAIKAEIGYYSIGLFTVAEHLGISDVSTLISYVDAD